MALVIFAMIVGFGTLALIGYLVFYRANAPHLSEGEAPPETHSGKEDQP
jgi:hypothetical protein